MKYGEIRVGTMKGVEESELRAILFEETGIEVGEFDLEFICLEGVILFVPYFFLRLEHRLEGLHVGALFWVIEILCCGLGFKVNSPCFIESRLFNLLAFRAEPTHVTRLVRSETIFPNGAVSDRPVG